MLTWLCKGTNGSERQERENRPARGSWEARVSGTTRRDLPGTRSLMGADTGAQGNLESPACRGRQDRLEG